MVAVPEARPVRLLGVEGDEVCAVQGERVLCQRLEDTQERREFELAGAPVAMARWAGRRCFLLGSREVVCEEHPLGWPVGGGTAAGHGFRRLAGEVEALGANGDELCVVQSGSTVRCFERLAPGHETEWPPEGKVVGELAAAGEAGARRESGGEARGRLTAGDELRWWREGARLTGTWGRPWEAGGQKEKKGQKGQREKKEKKGAEQEAVSQVVAGEHFWCVLEGGGQVKCGGQNAPRGTGRSARPAYPPSESGLAVCGTGAVQALTAGKRHLCWLRRDGSVGCAGDGSRGQLGGVLRASCDEPAGTVGGWKDVTRLMASGDHTCAERSGEIFCWGGAGKRPSDRARGPQGDRRVVEAGAVELVSAGEFACARLESGDVTCWGGGTGPLAQGTIVPEARGAQALFAGDHSLCAVMPGNDVRCWTRIDLEGADRWVSHGVLRVSAGVRHMAVADDRLLVVQNDGRSVLQEGSLYDLQRGRSSGWGGRELPVVGATAASLSPACVLTGSGAVHCRSNPGATPGGWGPVAGVQAVELSRGVARSSDRTAWRLQGPQLSVADTLAGAMTVVGIAAWPGLTAGPVKATVETLNGQGPVVELVGGPQHLCLRGAQHAWCRGDNQGGQVLGVPSGSPEAASIELPQAVRGLSVGDHHTCARLEQGQVRCWGTMGSEPLAPVEPQRWRVSLASGEAGG